MGNPWTLPATILLAVGYFALLWVLAVPILWNLALVGSLVGGIEALFFSPKPVFRVGGVIAIIFGIFPLLAVLFGLNPLFGG